jgi:hypothetical protein
MPASIRKAAWLGIGQHVEAAVDGGMAIAVEVDTGR